jgi:hypothetical protein
MQNGEPPWVLEDLELRGRAKEKFLPLIKIAALIGGETKEILISEIKDFADLTAKERQEDLEGRLAGILFDFYKINKSQDENGILEVSFEAVWNKLTENLEGFVPDREPNVIDAPELGRVTKYYVGRRLREIFQGERFLKGKERVRFYRFRTAKLARIFQRYGLLQGEMVRRARRLPEVLGQNQVLETNDLDRNKADLEVQNNASIQGNHLNNLIISPPLPMSPEDPYVQERRPKSGESTQAGASTPSEEAEQEAPVLERATEAQKAVRHTCMDCVFWKELKCAKYPGRIVVTPWAVYAESCQFFKPKEVPL